MVEKEFLKFLCFRENVYLFDLYEVIYRQIDILRLKFKENKTDKLSCRQMELDREIHEIFCSRYIMDSFEMIMIMIISPSIKENVQYSYFQ